MVNFIWVLYKLPSDVDEVNYAALQQYENDIYLIGVPKTRKGVPWGVDDFCAMQHKI